MQRLVHLIAFHAALAASAGAAAAAGVVGAGTATSCTETALDAALMGGGLVTFKCGGVATIVVTTTKMIEVETTIDGAGRITISGAGRVRPLAVAIDGVLSLAGLTIADGYSGIEPGGAIRNLGRLTLSNCTVSGSVSDSFGGGIENEGMCSVVDSTVLDNEGVSAGGGIANFRDLTVRSSTIFRNTAGLIYPFGDNTPGSGGGIANFGNIILSNVTFSNNAAISNNNSIEPVVAFGGGIDNEGTAVIFNSTLSRNQAPDDSFCGGIHNAGRLMVKNTIIARSVGVACCNDVPGVVATESTNNLLDDGYSYCGSSFLATTGTALHLAGLAYYGGPTLTVALLPNSAAIGVGDPTACMDPATVNAVDQRGTPRFGPGDSSCDVGAFETLSSSSALPTPTPAQTFLALDGQPGDFVSQGRQQVFTMADGTFWADHTRGQVTINFLGDTPGIFWTLSFSAPYGLDLTPGDYAGAVRSPPQDKPGLDVSGDGRGCGYAAGRFSVSEGVYSIDGSVETFAADFEQHCEAERPALFGSIRVNSNVPTASARAGTPTGTPTPTPPPATPTSTAPPAPPPCYGDCDRNGTITVDELLTGVSLALGDALLGDCSSFDTNSDGRVTVDELLVAVAGALGGCRPL